MRKKHYFLLCMIIVVSIYLVACKANKKPEIQSEEKIKVEESIKDLEKDSFDMPEVSSRVYRLPWENDEDFKKSIKENNTDVLIAAFCSVLKDPLPGEEYNVKLAAKSVKGLKIKADDIFSQNKTVGPYDDRKGYKEGASYSGSEIVTTLGGGVCKLATTLYNVAVISNLDIVERYNHTMPVSYVPYGQDATVSYGNKDLKFKNNTKDPILIWSKMIDNRLYVGFYGKKSANKAEWHHEILERRKTNTKYSSNSELNKGEERTIIKGMDGALVKSWVTIEDENGNMKKKDLGESSYWPMPTVIETNK